jgi:antirestriction protein ArdC
MAGAFVCASLGIVPTVRHADYIGSWLEVLREDIHASPSVGGKMRPIPAGRRFQFMMAGQSCAEAPAADMPR